MLVMLVMLVSLTLMLSMLSIMVNTHTTEAYATERFIRRSPTSSDADAKSQSNSGNDFGSGIAAGIKKAAAVSLPPSTGVPIGQKLVGALANRPKPRPPRHLALNAIMQAQHANVQSFAQDASKDKTKGN